MCRPQADAPAPVAKPTPTATPTPATSTPPAAVVPEGGSSLSLVVDGTGIHKYDEYYVTGAVPRAEGSVYVFAAARRAEPQPQ